VSGIGNTSETLASRLRRALHEIAVSLSETVSAREAERLHETRGATDMALAQEFSVSANSLRQRSPSAVTSSLAELGSRAGLEKAELERAELELSLGGLSSGWVGLSSGWVGLSSRAGWA
jgi:hypothetical protein